MNQDQSWRLSDWAVAVLFVGVVAALALGVFDDPVPPSVQTGAAVLEPGAPGFNSLAKDGK